MSRDEPLILIGLRTGKNFPPQDLGQFEANVADMESQASKRGRFSTVHVYRTTIARFAAKLTVLTVSAVELCQKLPPSFTRQRLLQSQQYCPCRAPRVASSKRQDEAGRQGKPRVRRRQHGMIGLIVLSRDNCSPGPRESRGLTFTRQSHGS